MRGETKPRKIRASLNLKHKHIAKRNTVKRMSRDETMKVQQKIRENTFK